MAVVRQRSRRVMSADGRHRLAVAPPGSLPDIVVRGHLAGTAWTGHALGRTGPTVHAEHCWRVKYLFDSRRSRSIARPLTGLSSRET
jgi:hypothetical protein